MLSGQNRVLKSIANNAHNLVAVFLLACGDVVAAPFISNQNQYLAHALSVDTDAGRDWFRNTVDPYPFFSALARLTLDCGGILGIRILALLGTAFAMASVYFLARLLTKHGAHSSAPLLATVTVGLTLLPHTLHAFEGVAGQYIISTPAYLQPSMFGCLLLLAIPCMLAAQTADIGARRRLWVLAYVFAALGCAFHPTYLASAMTLLAATLVANVSQGGRAHLLYFAFASVALVAIAVAANPALISMAFSSPEYSRAAERFAFERIPFHARMIDWQLSDIVRFSIAVIAIPIADKRLDQRWLAHFLTACLTLATISTLLVQLTGETKLLLLFPWRVSVFILPISLTIMAVWIAGILERAFPLWKWRWLATSAAACMATYGCAATFGAEPPATLDELTALVRATHPSGVGLVPLSSDNVRLNAPANIYVDWKSPPYAGDDLIEWWRRVDQVRRFERDVDRFCSTNWHADIRWMLLTANQKRPFCVSRWTVAGRTVRWRVLEKN